MQLIRDLINYIWSDPQYIAVAGRSNNINDVILVL
jgi:hypothetical protein